MDGASGYTRAVPVAAGGGEVIVLDGSGWWKLGPGGWRRIADTPAEPEVTEEMLKAGWLVQEDHWAGRDSYTDRETLTAIYLAMKAAER